ncbi:hypothetical protein FHS99_003282 [Sphingomonas prati]|uniref:Uncharacterized protein n=2 Tax=Sphingomonas prati TaxID=1843237 RepID=A0A7W9F4S6_9SPHN|nr:hypothetical protein [Sphingomonas prati]
MARNLETLHLLLAGLMGRGSDDDTVKLRITLIGGLADFEAMDLRNTRWQQGPFARPFMIARYYDPRDEGAVMASSRFDQTAVLQQGLNLSALTGIVPGLQPGAGGAQVAGVVPLLGLADSAFGVPQPNELSVAVPATSMLYSLFAQHWLMTYFPGAYPRWYLDGFGQLFSTMTIRDGRVIEYGRAPENSDRVIRFYGGYPLERLFDGRYLDSPERSEWTPFHAWLLTHYLFFSDDRRPQVRRYLAALGSGASQAEAAQVFGDLPTLSREVRRYHSERKPYFRIELPVASGEVPLVRRVSLGEAAFIKGRLELGARVDLPPLPDPDASPEVTKRMTRDRERAVAARDGWRERLRRDAERFPSEAGPHLLVAEAECRSDSAATCEAAADRALALVPGDPRALAWKGMAQVIRAAALPQAQRSPALGIARTTIGRANRADTDAVLPLLAYGFSWLDAGVTPPAIAADGLSRVVERVPASPGPRLMLGRVLAARGQAATARTVLRPITLGPYESPERSQAAALIATLPAN